MLKTRITTAEQNNEMWSSDDKDYTYETENNSKVQDDEDASFDLDQQEDGSTLRQITSRAKSGIYEVDFKKPYKPIFIVFCDLVCFVAFLIC